MATASSPRRPKPEASPFDFEDEGDRYGLARRTAPIRIPAAAGTLAGFRAWVTSDEFPQGVRATFLGSEILLDMSPEEIQTHILVKGEVGRVFTNIARETRLGIFFADGTQVSNAAVDLSNQPDGTFVTRESLRAGRVKLIPREGVPGQFMEIEGTPDLVLEVVSRWSVRKDTKELREKYHRAGIPEYWLLDARGDDVDFRILVREEGGYVEVSSRDGWVRSPVFGREFLLERILDESGFWEYTLSVR